MEKFWLNVFILFTFTINCECKKVYDNYTLLRTVPTDESHLDFLKQIRKIYDVNFWRSPGGLRMPVDFTISPIDKEDFLAAADSSGVKVVTMIDNIQSAFDAQNKNYKSYIRRNMDSFNWQSYSRLEDIYAWLSDLENKYPNDVKIKVIGTTYEGRDIKAVQVAINGGPKPAKVIVEGGVHAREWISVAFVTYLLNEIVYARFGPDKALQKVAAFYEWHFVPVLNPDGYEYSHTHDQMWRKNRRGVDINRNFGIAFGTLGDGFNEADEDYQGPRAFSERESYSLAKYLRSIGKNAVYYMAFHSYGQLMILPYCYTKDHILPDYDTQINQSKNVRDAIRKRRGTNYTIGTAFDQVGYSASGVSSDWAKKALNIPYVLTFEMCDTGRHGFALPTSEIMPTCEEMMDGLKLYLRIGMNRKSSRQELNKNSQSKVIVNKYLAVLSSVPIVIKLTN